MLALHGEPVALYDIKADILERINLINEKPEKVELLRNELERWLKEPHRQFGQED